MSQATFKIKTKVGILRCTLQDNFLTGLCFTTQARCPTNPTEILHPVRQTLQKQINSYLAGESKDFDIKLDLIGTPFQIMVWEALRKIPYGETKTYAEVAAMIKKPTAVRAVASAIAKNPIAIVIPCHRVIKTDGELGGYAWGKELKKRLLDLESGDGWARAKDAVGAKSARRQ